MREPPTLAEAEKALAEKLKRYKEQLRRFKKVKKEECYCDRLTCGRCAELDNLLSSMRGILWR